MSGIPAWGKDVIVHFNQNDAVYLFQGNYEPTPLTVKTISKITPEKAKEIAILKASQETAKWNVIGNELYIWIEDSDEPLLVYKVTLIKDLLFEMYYFVDSSNGKIVHKLSGTVD